MKKYFKSIGIFAVILLTVAITAFVIDHYYSIMMRSAFSSGDTIVINNVEGSIAHRPLFDAWPALIGVVVSIFFLMTWLVIYFTPEKSEKIPKGAYQVKLVQGLIFENGFKTYDLTIPQLITARGSNYNELDEKLKDSKSKDYVEFFTEYPDVEVSYKGNKLNVVAQMKDVRPHLD